MYLGWVIFRGFIVFTGYFVEFPLILWGFPKVCGFPRICVVSPEFVLGFSLILQVFLRQRGTCCSTFGLWFPPIIFPDFEGFFGLNWGLIRVFPAIPLFLKVGFVRVGFLFPVGLRCLRDFSGFGGFRCFCFGWEEGRLVFSDCLLWKFVWFC